MRLKGVRVTLTDTDRDDYVCNLESSHIEVKHKTCVLKRLWTELRLEIVNNLCFIIYLYIYYLFCSFTLRTCLMS